MDGVTISRNRLKRITGFREKENKKKKKKRNSEIESDEYQFNETSLEEKF